MKVTTNNNIPVMTSNKEVTEEDDCKYIYYIILYI